MLIPPIRLEDLAPHRARLLAMAVSITGHPDEDLVHDWLVYVADHKDLGWEGNGSASSYVYRSMALYWCNWVRKSRHRDTIQCDWSKPWASWCDSTCTTHDGPAYHSNFVSAHPELESTMSHLLDDSPRSSFCGLSPSASSRRIMHATDVYRRYCEYTPGAIRQEIL